MFTVENWVKTEMIILISMEHTKIYQLQNCACSVHLARQPYIVDMKLSRPSTTNTKILPLLGQNAPMLHLRLYRIGLRMMIILISADNTRIYILRICACSVHCAS